MPTNTRFFLTIFSATVLLCSAPRSYAQHTLEALSRKIVRVLNTEDTALLRPFLLNYEEYKNLYRAYLNKLPDTASFHAEQKNMMNESWFNSQVNTVTNKFRDYFVRRKAIGRPLPFTYKNYSFKIVSGEQVFAPMANISIYMQQDTSLFAFEGLCFYKVNNRWKLYRATEEQPYAFRLNGYPGQQSLFTLWEKEYARYHEERFPYPVAGMLWQQLFTDTALNMKLFFTREEFNKSITDKNQAIPAAQLNDAYSSYLGMIRQSLARLRDSANARHCSKGPFDRKNIVWCSVKNRFGEGMDGANLAALFGLMIDCPDAAGSKKYLAPGYVLLRRLSHTNRWKISFLTSDLSPAQNTGPLVPMVSLF